MVGTEIVFMRDLAIVMIVAAVTTLLFQRIRLPAVLGYIIAGVIIGPNSPPFPLVEDQDAIEILGQLGIVFLLFGLGLEFNLRKLRKVGATAVGAGSLEILLMLWIGFVVGRLFGLSTIESLFLGAIISISSTVIIVKVVGDLGQQDERWSQIVFGILIIEDMVAIFMLTFLPSAAGVGDASFAAVAEVLLRLGLFVASAIVLGILIVPRLVTYVAGLRLGDVFIVVVIGLALGLALIGSYLGFSVALGAFIMGALMSESAAARTVEERVKPIRDMFTAIFFVTVGMLLDPRILIDHWQLVAAVAVALVVGKILSVTFAVFITGNPPSTALRAGFGLAQMGEFSFIIAALGGTLGVIQAPLFEVAVTVSAITAFTAPLLIRAGPGAVEYLSGKVPRALVTYASLYDTWVRRLRTIRASPKGREETTHELVRAGAFATVIVAILVIEASLLELELELLEEAAPIPRVVAEVIVWTVIGLLVLPFVYLYMTALGRLGDVLSREAMPSRWGSTQQAPLVRRVLRATFMMAGTVALGVLVLAVATPILPALPVLMAVGLAVLLSAALLYRALVSFQARVDETLSSVLSQPGPRPQDGPGEEILAELREKYPWGIEVKSVTVPLGSSTVGMSIETLRLRSETGATIIGMRRGDQLIINPPAASSLAPMDKVFLVGEPDHISKAERVILEGLGRPPQVLDEPSLAEVHVQPEHSCIGMTLGSLHLHERTGATVIGIKRGERQLKDPSPDLGLEVDDVLLVLGTRSNIERAEELICGDRAATNLTGDAADGPDEDEG